MLMYREVIYYDDGSCNYPASGYDWSGSCLNDVNGDGICD